MNILFHTNNWLYHSAEILICDIKIAFWNWRIARLERRLRRA